MNTVLGSAIVFSALPYVALSFIFAPFNLEVASMALGIAFSLIALGIFFIVSRI